jgi:hypothetical protein
VKGVVGLAGLEDGPAGSGSGGRGCGPGRREESGFTKDLEAIADAQDEAALGGEVWTAWRTGLKRAMAPQRR